MPRSGGPRPRRSGTRTLAVVLGVLVLVLVAGVGGWVLGRAQVATVAAPTPVSPLDGQSFDIYPRVTNVAWEPVAGASAYLVEVQYWNDGDPRAFLTLPDEGGRVDASTTSFTFSFVGKQAGRWRVTAVGRDGVSGPPSAWSGFVYQR